MPKQNGRILPPFWLKVVYLAYKFQTVMHQVNIVVQMPLFNLRSWYVCFFVEKLSLPEVGAGGLRIVVRGSPESCLQ